MSGNSGTEVEDYELAQAVRERRLSTCFLLFVIGLMLFDIFEDILEGDSFRHVAFESSLILLAALASAYLWRKTISLHSQNIVLNKRLRTLDVDNSYWKEKADEHLRGLAGLIEEQFGEWKLTAAEQEVGLLLLKGYSHKEIAQIRSTSDRTIRHQAAAIYSKSRLDGRAQLSAFFLEDLLFSDEVHDQREA